LPLLDVLRRIGQLSPDVKAAGQQLSHQVRSHQAFHGRPPWLPAIAGTDELLAIIHLVSDNFTAFSLSQKAL
jgi:hypothetical protein